MKTALLIIAWSGVALAGSTGVVWRGGGATAPADFAEVIPAEHFPHTKTWLTFSHEPSKVTPWAALDGSYTHQAATQAVVNSRPIVVTNTARFGGVDDYALLPRASGEFGAGNFTVMAWVFTTRTNAQTVLDHDNTGAPLWALDIAASRWRSVTRDVGNAAVFCNGDIVQTGVWTHVALTRSGTTARLYLNGALAVASNNPAMSGVLSNAAPVAVGCGWNGGAVRNYLSGYLDDLVIASNAWDAAAVTNFVTRTRVKTPARPAQ